MVIIETNFHKPNKELSTTHHIKKGNVSSYRHGGSSYACGVSPFLEATAYPASPERKNL